VAGSAYARYLAAKKTVDDRALTGPVLECLEQKLVARPSARLRVIEVGAGLGTMPARLIERGLLEHADYTLLDQDAGLLHESRAWLTRWADDAGLSAQQTAGGLQLSDEQGCSIALTYRTAELSEFLKQGDGPYDLVIANAVLDLVDVPAVLPGLLSLLAPDGLYWFSVNYDGETILLPELADDAAFLATYNRSMDTRQRNGAPAGDSKTGRHLFTHLKNAGATISSAASSDWVVFASEGQYPHAEAEFLRHIIDTMDHELRRHASVDAQALARWIAERYAQIDRAELVYIAHQLDFLGSRA
jgi:hypothetical protein